MGWEGGRGKGEGGRREGVDLRADAWLSLLDGQRYSPAVLDLFRNFVIEIGGRFVCVCRSLGSWSMAVWRGVVVFLSGKRGSEWWGDGFL